MTDTNTVLRERLNNLSAQEKNNLLERLKRSEPSPDVQKAEHSSHEKKGNVADSKMKFSLFFFSDNGSSEHQGKYHLLLECAKYADQNGFHALWTPERHFHEFGGPYPNPSVLAAALATTTTNIQLRAGSVVLPLHHPMRVAEEWSVVDNLSGGRIGLAYASGWHPNDFILSSAQHEDRKEVMVDSIHKIRELWRGEKVIFTDSKGKEVEVALYPKPVQKSFPIWITSAGNPQTWQTAGRLGAHILTGLMEQTVEELGKKIELYHQSLREHGYDPKDFQVTAMLHTYVGDKIEEVKQTVKPALMKYLRNHLSMYETHLKNTDSKNQTVDLNLITDKDKETLLEHGFERYFNTHALLGDVESCQNMVQRLSDVGVTEVGCLVNFGLEQETILGGLEKLKHLKNVHQKQKNNSNKQ